MKMLRVNMQQLQAIYEPVPVVYERLGGRALIARLLLEEVPPECDPLGPDNKLIFTPGLLGGSGASTTGRLSVGGKSPLTRGVKEANAGGTGGDALAKMGIKAVVVEGQPATGELYLLHIQASSARLLPAEKVRHAGTYQTSEILQAEFGASSTVISIGPAGEFLMRGAGIAATGEKDQRSNYAARGGLGALMGSKGIKAVVIDRPVGKSINFVDRERFRNAANAFAQKLINDPKLGTQGSQHLYGTASIVGAMNEIGSLPTRGFSSGTFERSDQLRGEHLRELILAREGKVGTRCMTGCTIACRNLFVDETGKPVVGTLQYETIALVGTNLGLDSLDDVARLNYLCNDLGLDTIETGAALGVAAEASLASFGDVDSMAALLEQIPQNTPLGRMIGDGVVASGLGTGVQRVPAVLGQAMPGYDPRSLKGNGVTYATSPQGADHTAGNAFGARKEVNPLAVQGQRELSLRLQIIAAMLDSTGLCLFARPPIIADPQLMVDMINGIYGWGVSAADMDQLYRQVLRDENEFNRRAGITASDHRIPQYMKTEPLPPHQAVFDIPDVELDSIFNQL